MSELTLTLIRLGLLVLLWIFVFSVAGVLRGDLYGTRVVRRAAKRKVRAREPEPALPAPAPVPVPREQKAARMPRSQAKRVPRTLTVTEGSLTGTSVPLRDAGVLLGRNPECTLVLDDDFASGRHARLYPGPEGWVLEDLGSTNGTYLDGERLVTSQRVQAGSSLRIGATVIELRR